MDEGGCGPLFAIRYSLFVIRSALKAGELARIRSGRMPCDLRSSLVRDRSRRKFACGLKTAHCK
jgi:hypothetical protein